MSKGIKPVHYTYGVGMEFVATTGKQVKDELKSNLDSLSKLIKQYNEVLKVNPDADLSKLFNEMKKLQSVVSGINNSNNTFSDFVDKGVLDRVAKLESGLQTISSTANAVKTDLDGLKSSIASITDAVKGAGQSKFPATFDNLFGDVKDQSAKIKETVQQIDALKSSLGVFDKLRKEIVKFNNDESSIGKNASLDQMRDWIMDFEDLKEKLAEQSSLNFNEISKTTQEITSIAIKLSNALQNENFHDFKGLGISPDYITGLQNHISTIGSTFDSLITTTKEKQQELNAQLTELSAAQAKFDAKTSTASSSSRKSLGVQSDYTAQVKVSPKANEVEWATKINDTIKNIEGQLLPVRLTATFSRNNANVEKEIQGNLAQINHAVNVDLKVSDNVRAFDNQISKIEQSIKKAKDKLEAQTTFNVRFEYEDGGRFRDKVYSLINPLKKIESRFYIANGKKFISDVTGLRDKAKQEMKRIFAEVTIGNENEISSSITNLRSQLDEKLSNIEVNLSFKNAPQLLSQAKRIRGDIEEYYNNTPVNNINDSGTQNIVELSEKAKKAQENINKIKEALRSLDQDGFRSPSFLQLGMFNQDLQPIEGSKEKVKEFLHAYDELLAKTRGTKEQILATYGTGDTGFDAYKKDLMMVEQAESALNTILQSQIQYSQHKLEIAEKILEKELEITSVKKEQSAVSNAKEQPTSNATETDQVKTNKELAMSAEEATKKIRSLNGTLTQQKRTLKDLETNGIQSSAFVRLGEWDRTSGSFKKNSQDIQQLLSQYKELKAVRESAGGTKVVGDEASLRGKLSAILTQQKKHMSEIVAKNQEELASAKQLANEYKKASDNKVKATKVTDTASLKSLNQSIAQLNRAKKALEALQTKKFDALGSTGLGDINKRLEKAGSKQSFQELIDYYNKLIAKRDELEKSGQTGSPEYISYAKAYQMIERQLTVIYQDQLKYCQTRVSQLDAEIKKERELLQLKREQKQTAESTQSSTEKANKQSSTTSDNASSVVKLDGATLNTIAKDSTLQSISQKIDSILQQLNNGLVINGANVSINADNVAVANQDTGANVVMNSPNVQMSGANGSRIDLGTSTDINELYAKLQQFVQEHGNAAGLNHTKTKVSTDRTGNITGASISYASQDKLNGIVEYYKLVTDAETKTKSFQHASTVITENIEAYEKSIVNAYDKQNKMATRYDQIVAGLEKSLDPNANKTLFGTQYEESLRTQINDIKNGVAELDKTVDGQRVLFSQEELSEQKRILDLMVIDAEKLISESKNEKYAPISFDSKNIESSVGRYKAQLQAFIEQTKRAGLYTGDFKQQVDALANEIETVKVGKDLKAYQNNLAIAKSDFTSLRTYNKLYDDLSESIERQVKLKAQIGSESVGVNTKQQLELELAQEREISKNIIHQLQSNEQLYDINYKNLKVEEARQKAQQDIARSAAAQADKTINKQNNEMLATVGSVQKQYDAMRNSMASLPASAPVSDAMISKLKQYENLLITLKAKQQEIAASPSLFQSAEYKQGIDSLLLQLSQVKEKFTQIQTASQDFLQKNSNIQQLDTVFDTKSADGLNQMHQAMVQYVDQLTHGQGKLIAFKDTMSAATFEVKSGKNQIQELSVAYDQGTNSLGSFIVKTTQATSETQRFLQSLGHSFNNVARYLTTFGSVYRIFAMIRQGVTYVKEIDSALTELKKVTDATNASYDSFLQTASKTAGVLGSTVSELVDAAADFARLGYSMREAADLAEAAVVYKNVGDGIDDIATATESIISTMKAFGIEANNSMSIIDKFNEVGKLIA